MNLFGSARILSFPYAWRVAVCSAVLFSFATGCQRVERGLNPGDAAPEVVLKTLEGKDFDITSLKGKVVILNFWATWCGPCVLELPILQELYKKNKERGLVVVAVGIDDTVESLGQVVKEQGLEFPVLFDVNGDVRRRYKVGGVPESFLIDRNGKMSMWIDPSQGGVPTVRIMGVPDWHGADSLRQLEALLQQSPVTP